MAIINVFTNVNNDGQATDVIYFAMAVEADASVATTDPISLLPEYLRSVNTVLTTELDTLLMVVDANDCIIDPVFLEVYNTSIQDVKDGNMSFAACTEIADENEDSATTEAIYIFTWNTELAPAVALDAVTEGLPEHTELTIIHNPHTRYGKSLTQFVSEQKWPNGTFYSAEEHKLCIESNDCWIVIWYTGNGYKEANLMAAPTLTALMNRVMIYTKALNSLSDSN